MAIDGADWLRGQLTSLGCAACGQPYEPGRLRVLAERDGLFFVDLACGGCGTQAVAIVTIQLDADDVPHVQPGELFEGDPEPARPPVDADDVLRMHALLADFQGDATALLKRLRSGSGGPGECHIHSTRSARRSHRPDARSRGTW
jgi:hypothetical protein